MKNPALRFKLATHGVVKEATSRPFLSATLTCALGGLEVMTTFLRGPLMTDAQPVIEPTVKIAITEFKIWFGFINFSFVNRKEAIGKARH